MNIINGIRFNDRIYSHHGNETASTKGFVARQSRSGQQVWKPVGLILGEGDESLLPEMQGLFHDHGAQAMQPVKIEVPDDWDDRGWA